jgi:hypothetical protein
MIGDQKRPVKKWECEGSYFFLLTSNFSSPPHFTLRSNRFSLREFAAEKSNFRVAIARV